MVQVNCRVSNVGGLVGPEIDTYIDMTNEIIWVLACNSTVSS